MEILFKVLLFVLVIAMIVALFRGLYTLIKDKQGKRTVTALKWRVAFAILIISLLVLGFYLGYITPHTLPRVQG